MAYNFLARTHHVRSFRKLDGLRAAAERNNVFVLFKYGKPGLFYCEGTKDGVREWAKAMKQKNYMGYVPMATPNSLVIDPPAAEVPALAQPFTMERVDTLAQFAERMKQRRIWKWWRLKMGFSKAETAIEHLEEPST